MCIRDRSLAPVLLGPRRADPAPPEELLGPLAVEGLLLLAGHGGSRGAPPVGQVVGQPLADLGSERLGVGGIAQVHGATVPPGPANREGGWPACLLYTSDAADEEDSVDLGGRRIIKKKK